MRLLNHILNSRILCKIMKYQVDFPINTIESISKSYSRMCYVVSLIREDPYMLYIG